MNSATNETVQATIFGEKKGKGDAEKKKDSYQVSNFVNPQ